MVAALFMQKRILCETLRPVTLMNFEVILLNAIDINDGAEDEHRLFNRKSICRVQLLTRRFFKKQIMDLFIERTLFV